MPVEMLRKNIGYDSVCSSSDAVVEIDVPGHSEKVPVAILFSLAPTERTPQVA